MDSEASVLDNVEFEKHKAMVRFNLFRTIAKLFQFLEVLVALVLISWWSTRLPRAVKISGNFLFELAGVLLNPHVVFLIGNAIIISLYILCRENDAGNQNSGSGDLYNDYVRHSQAQQRRASIPDDDTGSWPEPEIKVMTTASAPDEEKQILCVSSDENSEKCDAVASAVETARKQLQKFQRTQSEKLKRGISGGELRRSETKTVHRRTERRVMTSFDSVETLSNDEFNLTVDAFIKRHQEFLMKQKLAENEDFKNSTKFSRKVTLCQ